MVSIDLQLNLPDSLAQEAEAQGLLHAEAIESLLRAELRRRHIDRFFDIADRLAALPEPITDEEIEAEIQAAREEKRKACTKTIESELALMANDPHIQRELCQIEYDFIGTEHDGLNAGSR